MIFYTINFRVNLGNSWEVAMTLLELLFYETAVD